MIIEQLDPLSNITLCLLSCRVHHLVHPFVLQGREKGFRERIVPTLTGSPDRMPQSELGQFLPILSRGVLRAAVAIKPNSV